MNGTEGITRDLQAPLEKCLNKSLFENYKLQGKVADMRYCKEHNEHKNIDIYDIIVAVVYVLLIVMNVIGSIYDVFWRKNAIYENPYLVAFSIPQNWSKLIAPAGVGADPRLERLRCFHGLRTLTMTCVIFSHTVFTMAYSYVENPLYIERSYEDPLKQILYNGNLVIHTFFVMSGFLLAYNLQIHSEKHKINWGQWPKGVLLRWLRLTPAYALILATISTLWRFLGDGPLWPLLIHGEMKACRQYWWAHVLYVNNYVHQDTDCLPQTWYVAADTQLFCLGLLICIAARNNRARKITLSLLLLTSFAVVAAHTYLQDLEAVVLQTPESYRNVYADNETFRLVYIPGHTNLSTYSLGLAGGFLTYHWQQKGMDFSKHKNYRILIWMLFPLGVLIILSGGIFYIDGVVVPLGLKVLYATFYKVIFQLLVLIMIIGFVFKLETVYRSIVEWRGFTWTGRVSYSAFLVHSFFQRGLVGIQTSPIYLSDYFIFTLLAGYLFLTFITAAALYLLVESPANSIIKALLYSRNKQDDKNQNDLEESSKV